MSSNYHVNKSNVIVFKKNTNITQHMIHVIVEGMKRLIKKITFFAGLNIKTLINSLFLRYTYIKSVSLAYLTLAPNKQSCSICDNGNLYLIVRDHVLFKSRLHRRVQTCQRGL